MAKPIVDMFSWNAPGNTLQDLYNWYLEGGDEDTGGGGGGGTTGAYYPQSTGGDNLQYDEMQTMTPTSDGVNYLTYDPNINYSRVPGPFDYMQEDPSTGEKLGPSTLAEAIVGDRGLKTIRKSDDDEVPPGWLTEQYNKLPGYVKQYALPTTIGAMNPIMGGALALNKFMRPDATESAAGIGGLYASEANLLGDLQQAGLLVDAGNQGIKSITGKNVVSLMGGYEEGQQEIYDDFISKYGSEEEVEQYLKDYAEKHNMSNWKKSFKYTQWKEAKFNKDRVDVMRKNTKKNLAAYMATEPPVRHHTDGDGPPSDGPVGVDAGTANIQDYADIYEPSAPAATTSYSQPGPHGNGGSSDSGSSDSGSSSDSMGSGMDDFKWARGGLIRRPYAKGGIVDLL